YAFKPLILASLLVLYTFSVSKRNKWYLLALIFSFLGDVFLLFEGKLFFMIGLVSFLIAHILFIKIILGWLTKSSLYNVVVAFIPFLITFSGLIYVLKDSLNELLIPVIIYGITISMFGVVSLLNLLNTKTTKALWMFFGALVFITSDSILAINKFYFSKEIFEILVMVTYIVAQYLIYRSMILKKV
ncbi:MAG: lysoplasmalogenase, partial [Lutibacter sp.]|nr:lysoplasmalogenase [Lutibacter sp.]